jgi:AcrR family transcriptional regulator
MLSVSPGVVCDTERREYLRMTTYQFIRSAMPTFTDAKRERVRESLHETGRELFARYGVRKTAISELTEAAGIGKGTFYQFYDSKDELYLEILEEYSEEVVPRLLDNSFEAYDDPEEAVTVFLDEIMAEFESNPLIHQIIVEDQLERLRAQYSDEEIEAERERSIEYFLPYIERWYDNGQVTGPDPETIAHTILTVALLPYNKGHIREDQYPAIRETLITSVAAGLTDGTNESNRMEDDHE